MTTPFFEIMRRCIENPSSTEEPSENLHGCIIPTAVAIAFFILFSTSSSHLLKELVRYRSESAPDSGALCVWVQITTILSAGITPAIAFLNLCQPPTEVSVSDNRSRATIADILFVDPITRILAFKGSLTDV